jgi:thiol-disulfide isomerase/thioredoxin
MLVSTFVSCSENLENRHGTTGKLTRGVSIAETFSELEPIISEHDDTTYVINFWATSCPPCIKEMPHFNQLHETYQEGKLSVHLVSLDMKRDIDSRVVPFIAKYQIRPEVVLLVDQNYSAWTEKIDSSWYGALPATLIIKNGERKFFMGAFDTYADLENEVIPFL